MLAPGDQAPDFTLPDENGDPVTLSDLRGAPVVVYFYPKASTPGCTTQACGVRDAWSALSAKAEIFGVSPDTATSHDKFAAKFALPFSLLVDEEHAIAESYGVWVEKSLYGRKYMGVERSTFVIGSDGRLRAVFRKVKPTEHVAKLLEVL